MARKTVIGARKPMSDETKRKIAESVAKKAKQKREELQLNKPEAKKKKKVVMVQMQHQEFDPALFEPMPTGKLIDQIFTFEGGLPKATNYIVVGDPGVGKCVVGETLVKIRIDSTNEELTIPISDLISFI